MQHIRDESAANPNRKSDADALIVEVLLEHGRLRCVVVCASSRTVCPQAVVYASTVFFDLDVAQPSLL